MPEDKVTYNGERWSNAEEDCIEIEDYNPNWPKIFRAECQLLFSVLPSDVDFAIEHFGSTAIPGIAAKPIIDILVICDEQDQWERLIDPIESLDYVFWEDNPQTDRMFFVKGMPPYGDGRTHHVHVRKYEEARSALLFRDYMKNHPEEIKRYVKLKRRLMDKHETDRDAYTRGKKEYIDRVVAKARKWKKDFP